MRLDTFESRLLNLNLYRFHRYYFRVIFED